MRAFLFLAQEAQNPTLPESGSGVFTMILFLVVPVAAVLAGRYILGARRSAESALRRAAAAEAEIRGLRDDLRADSAG
jgi:hypothetical protein